MTNAPPLGGLSSYQEAARAHGSVEEEVRFLRERFLRERFLGERILAQDQALDRSDWWSEFYAGVRKQSA